MLHSKKIILEEKRTDDGNVKKFADCIKECLSHIKNVLNNGTGIVPLDSIKKDVLKLIHKEQVELIAERHKTFEELDALSSKIDKLKETLLNLVHKTVADYVDESFIKAIKSIFDETFITKDEENFIFDISGMEEQNKISISILSDLLEVFEQFTFISIVIGIEDIIQDKWE